MSTMCMNKKFKQKRNKQRNNVVTMCVNIDLFVKLATFCEENYPSPIL